MSKEWFHYWFNSPEYLNVYKHRNDVDAEQLIRLILGAIPLNDRARILDLACGTGRHSILLAKKNYDVTAVDLSENLLNIAKCEAADKNVKINFIHSDIREFDSQEKFDLILNLFTSFGYFETDEENLSILNKAYHLLNKSGYFVLDFLNAEYLSNNLASYTEEFFNDIKIEQFREIQNNRVNKKIILTNDKKSKEFYESVRLFNKIELENYLKNIGFDIFKTFGDFLGNDFEQFTSPRLIMICRK